MEGLYPLTFRPVLKDYVWGGRAFQEQLGRDLPPGVTAESWEIAAHKDGESVVNNGPYLGLKLSDLQEQLGLALIGRNSAWAQGMRKFPLLVKLLDAHSRLSVQVHPNDAYALANEQGELGKTEMWVVLHATEDAAIILGITEGTTAESFRRALEEQSLEPLLHNIEVKTGDYICVPSGSLHAIMGGAIIAEIQQNSNTTYRVYDWGRDRPLHIDKAIDVINFQQVRPSLPIARRKEIGPGVTSELLCANRYFNVERVTLAPGTRFDGDCCGKTFEIWGTIAGKVDIRGGGMTVACPAVTFALLPAKMGEYSIQTTETAQLLRTYVAESA